ncbi:thioredoxin domain-containing protein [Granulicella mallensis]|uniref:Protein-disulfide isomerase n=1 Tax=Granulicella mallensis TaxID=940614 RepID=A0A7W7ZLK9_9BACT|nr:thioredoxin domain-containing protein [Granulicella mallensis]MBB5061977.1 protein-disulfide isomerase [Granulicella mallensis]
MKNSTLATAAGLALLTIAVPMFAQAPGTPKLSPATQAAEPQAPKPQNAVPPANPFPPVNPKNFTATTPTADEVNSFLKAIWGYDENRIWSVAAILATPAPGVSKVVVFVSDKSQPGKGTQTVFFTTPDGKHAIADNVIDFGATPFAATRKILQDRVDGPARGAAGKELLLVEFADLQCPHCKEVQATMDNIAQDFPQARIVFENYPLSEIHPYAFRAAAEGECVRKAKGDSAFFTYAQTVFDMQDGLTPERADATLSAAVTKAGGDPAAAAACAETPAIKDAVKASQKLGTDVGVDQTPILAVNGHLLPVAGIPYETLKKIIAHQAGLDGVVVHLQPTLSTLK